MLSKSVLISVVALATAGLHSGNARADEALPKSEEATFYSVAYYGHNLHFLAVANALAGNSTRAIAAAKKLYAHSERWTKEATQLDFFMVTPAIVLIQFGRWDDILALPRPPTEVPLTVVVSRAARCTDTEALERAGADVLVATGENEAGRVRSALAHLGAGDVTYSHGMHEVRAGGSWRRSAVQTQQTWPGSHVVSIWNGYPNMLAQVSRDYQANTTAQYAPMTLRTDCCMLSFIWKYERSVFSRAMTMGARLTARPAP